MGKLLQNKYWLRTLFIVLGFFVLTLIPLSAEAGINDDLAAAQEKDKAKTIIENDGLCGPIKCGPFYVENIFDDDDNLIPPDPANKAKMVVTGDSGEKLEFILTSWSKDITINRFYFIHTRQPKLYIELSSAFWGSADLRWGTPGQSFNNFALINVVNKDWGLLKDWIETYLEEIIAPEYGLNTTSLLEGHLSESAEGIMAKILETVNNALEWIIHGLIKFLDKLLIVSLNQDGVIQGWAAVRNAANIMLVVALLFIAVFNAMRFQIEYYTAKALIPRLAMAAIGINFSFVMTKAIVDTGNIMSNYFLSQTNFEYLLGTSQLTTWITSAALVGGVIAILLLKWVVFLAIFVAVGTVFLVLLFRIAVLYILAMFSPLVFLFMVLPFTRGLTGQWWNYLVKFTFMGAVMSLILFAASNI